MRHHYYFLKPFFMGLLIAVLFFAIIGAVNRQTPNISGDKTEAFNSVYASSDGNVVYVCDNDKVYRSTDGGANWAVVLQKDDTAGF